MKRRTDMKFITCSGSRFHTHFNPRFDGRRVVLDESGVSDIQTAIESHGRYTDLHYMLHRLSVGDSSVISVRPPIYGDFSGLPSNPVDAINIVHSAESAFNALSLEDRAKYNNDFRAWLAVVLSGSAPGGSTVPADPEPAVRPVEPFEPEVKV